jgi:hypothetical protein
MPEDSVVGYTLIPDRLADFNQRTGVRRKLPSCWWYVCYLLSPSATVSVLGTIDGESRKCTSNCGPTGLPNAFTAPQRPLPKLEDLED